MSYANIALVAICVFLLVVAAVPEDKIPSFLHHFYYKDSTTQKYDSRKYSTQPTTPKSEVRKSRVFRQATCTCGSKTAKKGGVKIVGGQLAEEHAWPWLAPLVYLGGKVAEQFCGSSIIANNYVLTAGHCLQDITTDAGNILVYMGVNAINSTDSVKSQVSEIKIHPNYDPNTLDNDIALIKLARPIEFSDVIKPVCLQQVGLPFVGKTAIVSGWGSIKTGGTPVNRLRQVKIKVIPAPDCVKSYASEGIKITQNMMCASLPKKDSCQGDSGGPLFLYNPGPKRFNQIGIVSFGRDCGNEKFPGVYTRVNRYIKWIQDNTQDATYCDNSF